MPRVLVTGGAGFIGSHVTEALVTRGFDVVVLDDLNDYYDPAIKRENIELVLATGCAELVEADIREPATWAALDPNADWHAVVHLAARAGVRPSLQDPLLYATTNVDGTARALYWAASAATPIPFVFASSSSIYGDDNAVPFSESGGQPAPVSPYGATKHAAEALIEGFARTWDLPAVCLRFFTVYGPRQRPDLAIHKFARLIDAGEAIPVYGDGSSARDYTHITDLVSGVLSAMDLLVAGRLPHRVYNLGSDRAITLDAMIAAVERAVDRTAFIERLPLQPGDVVRTWADLTRSRAELGYSPQVEFEDGLADFVRWLRR